VSVRGSAVPASIRPLLEGHLEFLGSTGQLSVKDMMGPMREYAQVSLVLINSTPIPCVNSSSCTSSVICQEYQLQRALEHVCVQFFVLCIMSCVARAMCVVCTSGGHNLDPMIAVPCSEHLNAQRRLQHHKSCI
jgi:hypothetical protein